MMKMMNQVRWFAVPVLLMALHAPAALAMGDDDSDKKTPDCPKGQVYDSKTKSCVPEKTSMLSDEDKTNYAYHLAKKGEYQAALTLLDKGMSYYQKSIALDPRYAKVREYLGEAWMIKGRPDLAKEQLTIIKSLCGVNCEEYQDLNAAINGHPES